MPVLMHQPPEALTIHKSEPLIFLAGPIQGASDWQMDAVGIIADEKCERRSGANLHIANPRRNYLEDSFNYEKQVKWEKLGLKRAAKNGAIVFWFAAQDPDQEYEEGRAYAQTSRIEFGRVLGWFDYNPFIDIVIGIENGYTGSERYFRTCAQEKRLPLHKTLSEVCSRALELTIER